MCPSTDGRVNKSTPIPTTEPYSTLKWKDILTHATTWMNLQDIMLSKMSQLGKDKHYTILLM